ncbi:MULTISPECIES: cell division protein ZapA [unclassified Granulicatella]|uniref:cell division protein ZapA n=1 Tax=unclassified Granulicatella TaxID=2630493 RepID=UPI0013D0B83F|nr:MULTISPECIES: cell division protein ZapA [unclassified Granulicatella]MBS4749926.1 cell division protein ZapA [Carnobacteriaceae bacterium zg-ZUI78]QMI86117.1 cell division protein ZapA [Carnobacteriaceae bacterium zg-84]
MDTGKRRYKAVINGETYIIVGNKSDEHLKVATQLVDEQLTLLKQKSPKLSKVDCAVLLALNTVSKQLSQEQEIIRLQRKIAQLESKIKTLEDPEQLLIRGVHTFDQDVNVSVEKKEHMLVEQSLFSDDDYVPAIRKK